MNLEISPGQGQGETQLWVLRTCTHSYTSLESSRTITAGLGSLTVVVAVHQLERTQAGPREVTPGHVVTPLQRVVAGHHQLPLAALHLSDAVVALPPLLVVRHLAQGCSVAVLAKVFLEWNQ